MQEVKKVSISEGLKYLIPALRILNNLGDKYMVRSKKVIIDIPVFIPVRKGKDESPE